MLNVLLAWELGGGLGHVNRLCALGDALAADGRQVLYALVQPSALDDIPGPNAREAVPAPFLKKPEQAPPYPICNYGELLLRCGYRRPVELWELFNGWCRILKQYQPRLLVADHSPTALLAARALGIPAVRFGTGFAAPPSATPFPLLSPSLENYRERVAKSEQAVLETVNRVLVECKYDPLTVLEDMFDGIARDFVASFPELDQYPGREGVEYCGPITTSNTGIPPQWPAEHEPRVFAYLKGKDPNFRAAVAQLADSGANLLIFASDVDPAVAAHYAARNVAFAEQPVDLGEAAAQADADVCHAGHTSVLQCLAAGTPLILLPTYREQTMTAERVVALGAGVVADPTKASSQLGASLTRVLEADICKAAAGFAEAHRTHSRDAALERLVDACRNLAGPCD